MTILHKNLAGNQLHESKGLSASSDKQYNLASSGANSWAVLIGATSGTASTSTEVDITGLSGYSVLILTFQDLKLGSSANLELLVSSDNGSTFNQTSIYYSGINQDGTGRMQTSATALQLTSSAVSDYYTGKLIISNFNQAVPSALYGHTAVTTGSNFTTSIAGFGYKGFINSSTAWNALRIKPSTGTLTSGKIILEGIKS